MTPAYFYFSELLDRLGSLFTTAGLFMLIGGLIVIFALVIDKENIPKHIKKIIIIGMLFWLLGSMIPSKETCYKMFGIPYDTTEELNDKESD